ncbi:flippase [Vibrio owensii]|uniref:flippase n=1 Tax=Vibrio owensii TaxID=696485 RepID=UPI002FF2C730
MRKVILNSIWYSLPKINSILGGVVLFIFITRGYNLEQVGHFTYSQSVAAIISVLTTFGLPTVIVKYLSNDKVKNDYYITNCITFCFILASASLILLLFLSVELLIIVLSCVSIFKSTDLIKSYFDFRLDSKKYVKFESAIILISIFFKVLLAYSSSSLIYLAILYVLESLLVSFFLLLLYKKNGGEFKPKSNLKLNSNQVKEVLVDALPVLFSSAIFIVYSRVDQLMIYNILGAHDQAVYAASVKLSEGWYFIPLSLVTSFYSLLATRKGALLYETFSRACVKVNILTLPVAFFVTFFCSEIITFIYGEDYLIGSTVLSILIWNGVIISLSALTFRYLIIKGLRIISVYRSLLGLGLNLILNYILIPIYGINGAAIATLISQLFSLFLINGLIRKTKNIFLIQCKSLIFITHKVG